MANQRVPNDPYRSESEPDIRDPGRLDNELQPDPELAEGPASGGRIAALAVVIAVILGAVFYGLNNSSIDRAGTLRRRTPRSRRAPPHRKARRKISRPRRRRLPACVT